MKPPRTGIEAFCARPDIEERVYLHRPWKEGEFVYATNGHILIETSGPAWMLGAEASPPPELGQGKIPKMIDNAFAQPCTWRDLPALPEFKPCAKCEGSGMFTMIITPETCIECGGYGERAEAKVKITGVPFALRYLRLLLSLPSVQIAVNGEEAPARFKFDGGRGLLMPIAR